MDPQLVLQSAQDAMTVRRVFGEPMWREVERTVFGETLHEAA